MEWICERLTSNRRVRLCLLTTALITITICSTSSPLYPINLWVDPNTYFTVGKSMFHGLIPYRDVFDHKGPYLYVLHGIAWLIDHNGFLLIWMVEIACCYFFLLFSLRTVNLFTDKGATWLMPILSLLVYTSDAFYLGDSVEELSLPLLSYALYLAIRSLKGKGRIKASEFFLVGVTSGIIFWMKFNLTGFYLAWVILPLVQALRRRDHALIRSMVFGVACGVVTVTLPVLCYFSYYHALDSLIDVYFLTNIFQYGNSYTAELPVVLFSLSKILKSIFKNPALWALIFLGLIFLWQESRILFAQVLLMILAGLLFIFGKGSWYRYYTFIFSCFCCFGVAAVYRLFGSYLEKFSMKLSKWILGAFCVFLFPFCLAMLSMNTEYLFCSRASMPQFRFAEIISQSDDPSLLTYRSMDMGFLTAGNLLPPCRYYCILNADKDSALAAQDAMIREGATNFVVTYREDFSSPLYELCAEMQYPHRSTHYFLYKRK